MGRTARGKINESWTMLTQCSLRNIGLFPKCFSLNSANSVTKIYDIKRTRTCHSATSCVRDKHATTVPARHMWDIGSLNWAQCMLQWFISFSEFTEFSESSGPFRKNSNRSFIGKLSTYAQRLTRTSDCDSKILPSWIFFTKTHFVLQKTKRHRLNNIKATTIWSQVAFYIDYVYKLETSYVYTGSQNTL